MIRRVLSLLVELVLTGLAFFALGFAVLVAAALAHAL